MDSTRHACRRLVGIGRLILPVMLIGAAGGGCGGGSGNEQLFSDTKSTLVWPQPPEPAHIRYVGQISMQTDVEKKKSWSHDFDSMLFGEKPVGVMMSPYAIAVDDSHRMFVADPGGGVVHVFDLVKRSYSQFNKCGQNDHLLRPVGLTLIGDRVFVVDSSLHSVCVFDKKGRFKYRFGGEFLKRPSGIAYWAPSDTLYITDTASHTVCVFSSDGNFIKNIGSRGLRDGQFNYPTHLWVDGKGNLYVSDTLNYRVQVFDSKGQFIRSFGRQGDRPGNFAHPCGIATDSLGDIYVTDRQFENVQIFNSSGTILMAFGEEGTKPGEFWLPAGICIDSDDRIYVADSFNKRVQIFEFLKDDSHESPR